MITIDQMPETPEIKNCKKHGDYEVKYTKVLNDKIWAFDHCMTCVSEKDAEDKLIKKKEYDARTIENERKHRENARVNAGISKRNLYKTFDDYICTNEGKTKAKNDCERYVKSFPTDKSLIMVGDVGTGKTLLASVMLDSLVDNYNCEIIKIIDIIREIKRSWKKDSEFDDEDIISRFVGLDLLIIDEVGSQFGSDTEKLLIFDVIDGRYEDMKPTILISNLDIDGIKDVIGERCVDRLREGGGSMIAFDWESARV